MGHFSGENRKNFEKNPPIFEKMNEKKNLRYHFEAEVMLDSMV